LATADSTFIRLRTMPGSRSSFAHRAGVKRATAAASKFAKARR
jgi:hypothetical protein